MAVTGGDGTAIESAELFRLLIEHSNDVVLVTDENGIHRFAGGPTLAILGWEAHELVGRSAFARMHPDDIAAVRAAVQEGMDTPGASRRVECRYIRKDGKLVHLEAVGTNRLHDPRIRGIVVNVRDMTQIREAHERLAESEARYRNIVDSSPMGIHSYRLEADGRLILVGANPAAQRILGIDHGPLVGRSIEEAFPPLEATEIPARYREAAKNGTPWTTSHVAYSDGRIRGAYEVYAFQTAPRSMAAIFLDITKRLAAEEQGRRLEAELAQAQRLEAIGRLAGGVAHDFNNLLTGITGGIGLALMELAPSEPLHATLLDVRRAAESAARLTKQLLAFSRRQVAEPRVIDLGETVSQSLRMLRRLIGERVDLRFGRGRASGNVRIDPGQAEQVLVNLAVNAADSMPDGGRLEIETANVELDSAYCARHAGVERGDYVRLTVSDTGCGMTPEVMAHVFEPFFSTKATGKGTGLGLATVFGIVKQNGGHIDVESEIGVGSTFNVFLPRVDAGAEPPPPPERSDMPRGSETVFLVEDDDLVRGIADRVLRRQGYRLRSFANGGDALLALESSSEPVDLLLTDVVLPGVDGRVLAQSMRAMRPELRVLYSSGYTDEVVAHHGILEEGIEFIAKPYSPLQLAQKVRAVLDRPLR